MSPLLNKRRIWEFVKDFLAINLGLAVYSLGWAAFLLPYHIATGALVGVCAIIYYLTSFPMSYSILIRVIAHGIYLILHQRDQGRNYNGCSFHQ